MTKEEIDNFIGQIDEEIKQFKDKMLENSNEFIFSKSYSIQAHIEIAEFLKNNAENYPRQGFSDKYIVETLYVEFLDTEYDLTQEDLRYFVDREVKIKLRDRNKPKDKYLIKGVLYEPICYGDEEDCWGYIDNDNCSCGDCGCKVGEMHLDNCDIERCPRCQGQMLTCDCGVKYRVSPEDEKFLPQLIEQQEKENLEIEEEVAKLLKKSKRDMEM